MAKDQEFADWLKAARSRARLSQRELSELSNIPIRTVQEYEQGRCSPGLSRGLTLVAILGDWFDSAERILVDDHA